MNFKKLIRSLTACAILTLSLGAAVHADESYPALEVSEQGYEEIIPSYDGTLCVAKQNEKYGLINAQGEVAARYAPATEPEKIAKDIKKELEKVEK